MKAVEKIKQALVKKGYEMQEAFFEPISYSGREGREGGWYVSVNDKDEHEVYDQWINWPVPSGVIGAIMYSAFICYNVKDALTIIESLPEKI